MSKLPTCLPVMDLPNLRKKPTYGVLLGALQALETHPNSWDKFSTIDQSSASDQAVVQRFLMSIIASDLEWLQESIELGGEVMTALEQKETLFDLASRRVAERCGRSGKYPTIFSVQCNAILGCQPCTENPII